MQALGKIALVGALGFAGYHAMQAKQAQAAASSGPIFSSPWPQIFGYLGQNPAPYYLPRRPRVGVRQ